MKAVPAAQRLCFAATVTADGIPNLSPKGTIRVWDDESLFFCDIASPQTRRNLERNDWIELNVVDTLSRRGYRFLGRGSIHVDDEIYREATSRIREEEGRGYEVDSVILVRIERVRPLISPGYEYVADEWAMREGWKEKRQWLDREFESHLDRHGALRGRVYTRGTPPASDQEAE